jgi:hypothetical protein
LSAERIHADDTTVPVLAKMKAVLGRIWTYVRDDRPFGGNDPPAALFYYSRNRAGEHPQGHLAGYVGLMQADAFNGYNDLYRGNRKPAPIHEAACWSHYLEHSFIWSVLSCTSWRGRISPRQTPDKIGGSAGESPRVRERRCRYRCTPHRASKRISPTRSGGLRAFRVAPFTLMEDAPYVVMAATHG